MHLTRRSFLRYSGFSASLAAMPAIAFGNETRSLKFVHTHTGEKLSVEYLQKGCYQPDCLATVNRFLRDFRTGDIHAIDPHLLDLLFDLQVLADRDDAFQIISAYRSPATNARLHAKSRGVATHSQHMEGKAVDIRLTGYPIAKLHALAVSLQRGGVGYYPASDFIHVDTARVRYW